MSKGPGAQRSVGKVSVDVVPDTSETGDLLKPKLEAIEKKYKIKLPVELDPTRAETEMAALRTRLEAKDVELDVKLTTSGVNQLGRRVTVITRLLRNLGAPLIALGRSFDNAARSVQRATERVIEMRKAMAALVAQTVVWVVQMVRAAVSADNARNAWQRLSQTIAAVSLAAQRIPRGVLIARDLAISLARWLGDSAKWTQRMYGAMFRYYTLLANAESAVKRLGSGIKGLGTNLKRLGDRSFWADKFYGAVFHAYSALGALERGFNRLRNIKLSDVVGGVRRLGSRLVEAARSGAELGRSIARGIGKGFDAGIRGLGKGISSTLSGLGKLFGKAGKAVSSFGSTLAGLGRTGWIVIAVLALIAPLVGLVAAAIAALPSTVALLATSIAVIALGMDGIKKAAQVAAPAVDALKASISEAFARDLTPVFARIANVLLPGIRAGMVGVAEGISTVAKSFVDVVTSADGMRQINTILSNTKAFFVGLVPFVSRFTQAILTLAEVGSNRFGSLAAGLGEWARQFNAIVETAARTGVLDAALRGLGQVVGAVGHAFNELFAAGLESAALLGGPLAILIKGLTSLLTALMPVFTAISAFSSKLLGAELTGIGKIVEELQPSLLLLADSLGELLTGAAKGALQILVALAKIVNGVLLAGLKAIQPHLPKITEFFVQLGSSIGNALLDLFTQLSPHLDLLSVYFGEILGALMPLLPSLNELVTVGLTALLDILRPLLPPLLDLAKIAFPPIVIAVQLLVAVLVFLIDIVSLLTAEIFRFTGAGLGELLRVFGVVLDVAKSVWPGLRLIISGALDTIVGTFQVFIGIFTGDWSRAWEGAKQIASGTLDMLVGIARSGVSLFVGVFRTIPSAIFDSLGNLGGLLWDSGRRLIQGFVDGIRSMLGAVRNAGANLMSVLRSYFPFSPAKAGAFSGKGYTTFSGRALVDDWAKAIEDRTPVAVKAVDGLMSASNLAANAEWQGHISSDEFGGVGREVAEAMSGWSVQIDANGIARMVNKTNRMNARR